MDAQQHPINPQPYQPTEQEHQIAWLKQCLGRIVWEGLLSVEMARKGQFDGHLSVVDNDAYGKQHLEELLDNLFKHDKGDNREPWERIYPFEDFKKSWAGEEGLAAFHCGDCTYSSCPCSRCWAE